MFRKYLELCEKIRMFGGSVAVTKTGLYTLGGTFLAFPILDDNRRKYFSTRNFFLQRFCVPYTKEERDKIRHYKIRHLQRYDRMMAIGIAKRKYSSIEELSRRAKDLYKHLEGDVPEQYFHLKDYRLEK